MVTDEDIQINELVRTVDLRMFSLAKCGINCPQCMGRNSQLLEVRFVPRWKCERCGRVYRYEPLLLIKGKSNEKED